MINESYPILNQKYYLLQKLGQGATSCVFLGCPIDNDKTLLAIKIITNLKIKQEAFEQETKSSVSFITRTSSDLLTTAWVN